MEEIPQATLWQRFYDSVGFFIVAFFAGLFLSIIEPVLLSLSGSDVSDAIWPYAYRTLQWTMFLRGNLFLFTLGSSLLMFVTFIVLQRHVKGRENPRWANGIGLCLLGLLSGVVLELVVRGATGTVLPALRATHGARHNLTVSSPHRPPEAAVSQREIRLADPSFRPLHPPSPPPPPPPPPSNPKLPEGPVPGLDEPGRTRRQVGRHEWSPAVTAFVHFQGQGRDEAAVTHARAAAGNGAVPFGHRYQPCDSRTGTARGVGGWVRWVGGVCGWGVACSPSVATC